MSNQTSSYAEFSQRLLGVARMWRRAADQALDDCGLSHATAMPLLTLSRLGDNARQGVIADQLGLEGPSLVRVIDLLLGEGLVTRREDVADRRAKILTLTASGRERVTEIEGILERLRLHLLDQIGASELAAALGVLRRLESTLLRETPQAEK